MSGGFIRVPPNHPDGITWYSRWDQKQDIYGRDTEFALSGTDREEAKHKSFKSFWRAPESQNESSRFRHALEAGFSLFTGLPLWRPNYPSCVTPGCLSTPAGAGISRDSTELVASVQSDIHELYLPPCPRPVCSEIVTKGSRFAPRRRPWCLTASPRLISPLIQANVDQIWPLPRSERLLHLLKT